MTIATEDFFIPLAPVGSSGLVGSYGHASYWPLPSRLYKREDYQFDTRKFYDDSWPDGEPPTGRYVFYFHGSGATGPASTNNLMINALVNAGICVIQPLHFNVRNSSQSPFRYGYGNVNAPHFMSHFIKTAIWPEATYKWALDNLPSDSTFMFLGHSMGAGACVAWGSNFFGRSASGSWDPRYKGMVANAATVGGLGDNTWNDVMRNLNTLSQMVYLLRTGQRVILTYANLDGFAPPDFSRRLQMVMRPDREVYMVSPGNQSHSWMGLNSVTAAMTLMWVEQVLTGSVVTERDGVTPAIVGPTTSQPVLPGDLPWCLEAGVWDDNGVWSTDGDEWIVRPETANLLNAMETTPDLDRIILINETIDSLISEGLWSKLAMLYVHAAHDERSARLNWRDPNIWKVNGEAGFSPNVGLTGTGSNHLSLGVTQTNMAPVFSKDSAHAGVYTLTNAALPTGFDLGEVSATSHNTAINPRDGGNLLRAQITSTSVGTVSDITSSVGHVIVSRVDGSTTMIRKDTSFFTGPIGSTGVHSSPVLLGHGSNYSTRTIGASHWGSGLSQSESLAMHNILKNYMEAVGAL